MLYDVFLQSLHDIDYVVQDRMFIEGILDVEFRDSTDKGMFITGTWSVPSNMYAHLKSNFL